MVENDDVYILYEPAPRAVTPIEEVANEDVRIISDGGYVAGSDEEGDAVVVPPAGLSVADFIAEVDPARELDFGVLGDVEDEGHLFSELDFLASDPQVVQYAATPPASVSTAALGADTGSMSCKKGVSGNSTTVENGPRAPRPSCGGELVLCSNCLNVLPGPDGAGGEDTYAVEIQDKDGRKVFQLLVDKKRSTEPT